MTKFFAGSIFTLSVLSLVQDFMGKEAYIEHVTNNWASAWITVPLALVLLVYSICIAYAKED
jgi:hypothetical protein